MGIHDSCLDLGAVIAVLELLSEAFMECCESGLCAAVVDHTSQTQKGAQASSAHDVTLFSSNHIWKEFLNSIPMTYYVDIEYGVETLWSQFQDSVCISDAGIIDQYGGRTMV